MHSQFGGDCKDHAKGFVLASLYDSIPGLNLRIDPMFSDSPLPDGAEGLDAYCRFLRIRPDQVINNDVEYRGLQKVTRNGRSQDYFEPHYVQDYDLFFDPDTGIGNGGRRHLPWRVIPKLVPEGSVRVLAVFQSKYRVKDFEEHFTEKHLARYQHFLICLGQGAHIAFVAAPGNGRLGLFRHALVRAYHPFETDRVGPEKLGQPI